MIKWIHIYLISSAEESGLALAVALSEGGAELLEEHLGNVVIVVNDAQ